MRGCTKIFQGALVVLLLASVGNAQEVLEPGEPGETEVGVPPAPAGPPALFWERVGYSMDHRVGSSPVAHFGVRVRNDGGGTLMCAFFPVADNKRFVSISPADLQLLAGEAIVIDIRAPAFIVDSASSFFENVTIAVLSNGGITDFTLVPSHWPSPSSHSMVNVQVAHGHFVWRQTPSASETVSYAGIAAVALGSFVLFLFAIKAHHIYRIQQLRAQLRARSPTSPRTGDWRGPSDDEKQRLDDEECAVAALARELEREDRALQWVHEQRMIEDAAASARGDTGAAARIANARALQMGAGLQHPTPQQPEPTSAGEAGGAASAGGAEGAWLSHRRGRSGAGASSGETAGDWNAWGSIARSGAQPAKEGRPQHQESSGNGLDSTAALAAAAAAAAAMAMAAAAGPRAGGSNVNGADLQKAVCSVCLSGPRDTAVLPCKHLGLCVTCAKHLCQTARPNCPICRAPINSYLQVWVV